MQYSVSPETGLYGAVGRGACKTGVSGAFTTGGCAGWLEYCICGGCEIDWVFGCAAETAGGSC